MIRFFRQGRSDARRVDRPSSFDGRRRSSIAADVESLERRAMLSADTAGLTQQIDWHGRLVDVHANAWIAQTSATSTAELGLAAGWRAESLGEGFFALTTPGAGVADVTGWAAGSPIVSYVEPDFVIAPAAIPNDPSFGSLWGLHNIGQSGGLADADIDAPEAWETTTGSRSVVIAVIDTGVDYGHRDLAANAWRNSGEIAGDGVDNDGNGFVDDLFGWDFANRDADPMDDNGHGTHVAGTIGAVGGNGTGVAGVNWQVSIMALKFLTGSGSGSTSGAIGAINYATRMRRDFGVNVVATNNSWGGGGFSTSLRDAIAAGGRAGILFIAAAGNDGTDNDVEPHYPSNYTDDAVISVAATDRSNRLASFSNFGVTSVDVSAPGVSITSTLPGNRYGSYSGTSMATPHVAGVVG
ncbi:MAG: S8 family peptidase, partial [Planctomycetota bacterium]